VQLRAYAHCRVHTRLQGEVKRLHHLTLVSQVRHAPPCALLQHLHPASTGSMANNLSMRTFVPAAVHMTQIMLVMVENQVLKNSRSNHPYRNNSPESNFGSWGAFTAQQPKERTVSEIDQRRLPSAGVMPALSTSTQCLMWCNRPKHHCPFGAPAQQTRRMITAQKRRCNARR